MSLKDAAKSVFGQSRNERAAEKDKAEEDVEADPNVAGSRADEGEDGDYVGRTNPQFDAETQESGAEARSEAQRHSE